MSSLQISIDPALTSLSFMPMAYVHTPGICGPDITDELKKLVKDVKEKFKQTKNTDPNKAAQACHALISKETRSYAWDINELHKMAEEPMDVREKGGWGSECATSPDCTDTVEVDKGCYKAGTANYMLFGVMGSLCSEYSWLFSEPGQQAVILAWEAKKTWEEGSIPPNWKDAMAWARAGQNGWPDSSSSLPPPDAWWCKTGCPEEYKLSLSFRWTKLTH
jgi:hypothetical protein